MVGIFFLVLFSLFVIVTNWAHAEKKITKGAKPSCLQRNY